MMTTKVDAARLLGMKESEVASVEKSGDELVIVTTDGVTTTVAPDGSFSFAVPGAVPVEEAPVDDDPLAGLDKDGLVAFAEEHGLEVNGRLGEAKLRESLAEQLAAVPVEEAPVDETDETAEPTAEGGDDEA